MAVFTEVSFDEAAELFARLRIGELTGLQSCPGGIENTNYFADTTQGRYVLTLFERLTRDELPFYLHLMKHLAQRGIPVPEPQADATARSCTRCSASLPPSSTGCPATTSSRPTTPTAAKVGAMLARMHLAARDYERSQPNLRGIAWWTETVPVVLPFLGAEQAALIQDELAFQQHLAASAAYRELPRGPIHADLFRDNVMFDGDAPDRRCSTSISPASTPGCSTSRVCLNDWCIDLDSGRLVEERAAALVAAYDAVRPLEHAELRLLPALMRAAALRFWISRLWDLHLPRDAALLTAHDPTHFERVLQQRRASPWHPQPAGVR